MRQSGGGEPFCHSHSRSASATAMRLFSCIKYSAVIVAIAAQVATAFCADSPKTQVWPVTVGINSGFAASIWRSVGRFPMTIPSPPDPGRRLRVKHRGRVAPDVVDILIIAYAGVHSGHPTGLHNAPTGAGKRAEMLESENALAGPSPV